MKKKQKKPTAEIVFKLKRVTPSEILMCGPLNVWARDPRGFAVVKESQYVKVASTVLKGCGKTEVIRAPNGGKALMRFFEKLRNDWDTTPQDKYSPLVVIVPVGVEDYPAWVMIKNRAALIVEV